MLMENLSINPAVEGSCYLPLNASIVVRPHLYRTKGFLPSTVYGMHLLLIPLFSTVSLVIFMNDWEFPMFLLALNP